MNFKFGPPLVDARYVTGPVWTVFASSSSEWTFTYDQSKHSWKEVRLENYKWAV